MCVCVTSLTFISPGYASSHLSFIHSAICDQGSFSGTDACQNRPRPTIYAASWSLNDMRSNSWCTFPGQESSFLFQFPWIHQPLDTTRANSVNQEVDLLLAVAGSKDKLTSHDCCCCCGRSHPDGCRKLQTEHAAPTSVSSSLSDRCTCYNKLKHCSRASRLCLILSTWLFEL